MMNKKGDVGLGAIVVIILVLIFLSWLVNIGQKECNSNKDCKDTQYCGSDFACHNIPIIEKTTTPVIVQRNYTGAAWIIAIAAIIVAIIFNIDKIFGTFSRKENKEAEEKVYTNIPVYYEKQASK